MEALGPLGLAVDGQAVELGGTRARSVLIVLLVHANRSCPVDRLIDECWHGDPPPSARNTVQSYVSRLRTVLDRTIRIRRDGDHYRLALEPSEFDVFEFEVGHDRVRSRAAAKRWDEVPALCRELSAKWRGSPFGGGAIPHCAEIKAIELAERKIEIAELKFEAELACGNAGAGHVAEIRALVDQNPLREPLRRQLALALYFSGRQTEALRGLADFRKLLADEAGLVVSETISATEQHILSHDVPPWGNTPPGIGHSELRSPFRAADELPADLARLASLPIVGRADALTALRASVAAGSGGSSATGFACILGEPGVGKSRLAAALADERRAAGDRVLYGRCSSILDLPFQPFTHAIADLVDEVTEAERAALGPLSGSSYLSDVTFAEDLDIESVWAKIFSATSDVFGRLGAQHPVLLVIDDVQWASRPTLALLEHLVSIRRPSGLRVVATVRDTDIDASSPLMTMLDDLDRLDRATLLRLRGLGLSEVAELARTKGLDAVTDAEDLWIASAGNPLLLTHLIDDGRASADRVDLDHRQRIGSDKPAMPRTVETIVQRRVDQLGKGGEVLQIAALLGLEFDIDLLAAVVGSDPLEGLERAAHSGLLDEVSAGRWRFRHGLTTDALANGLSLSRRRRAHLSIASTLSSFGGEHDQTELGRLAHHACAGADTNTAERAVELATAAARLRIEQFSPDEALAHIADAENVMANIVGIDPAVEAAVHLAAAHIHQRTFDEDARRLASVRAAVAARRAGSPLLLARAALARSSFITVLNLDVEALDMIRDALAGLPSEEDALRSQLLARMAGTLAIASTEPSVQSTEVSDPVQIAEEAVRIADRCGDRQSQIVSRGGLIMTLWGTPHARRQIALADTVMRPADNSHTDVIDPEASMISAYWSATPRLIVGDRAGFRLCIERLMTGEAALHRPSIRAYALQYAAADKMMDGEYAFAQELASEAAAVGRHHSNFVRVMQAQLFWSAYEQGQLEKMLPLIEAGARANPDVALYQVIHGLAMCELGDLSGARSVLKTLAGRSFEGIPRGQLWTAVLCGSTEIAATIGDDATAATLGDLLRPFAGQVCVVAGGAFAYGAIDRFRAMAAATVGDDTSVRQLLNSATALEDHIGAPALSDRTKAWASRLIG